MNVVSLTFLVALSVLAAVIFQLPAGWPRRTLLALCNATFLATWVPNWVSWIGLGVFVLSGYLAAVMARHAGANSNLKARNRIVGGYVLLLLTAFVVLKKYQLLELFLPPSILAHTVMIVGLSYMLFRQIHFVVDSAEAQIEHVSLRSYLNYQLNLFGLLAGPIQRFQQFQECWASTGPVLANLHDCLKGYARLLIGILKVAVIAKVFSILADRAVASQPHVWQPKGVLNFAILFYGYPAYIYFNFSGYCDIVIAGAALVGMRMPENFNQPYLARNVIDFWARWHMTLTHWIRDYVFTPLYKRSIETWPRRATLMTYVCYFIALFLAGIWHGSSWNFVVFGLLHGSGVSATKIWEDRIVSRRGRKGLREYMKSPAARWLAIALTFHFVCFTLLFFPPDLSGRLTLLRRFVWDRAPAPAARAVLSWRAG